MVKCVDAAIKRMYHTAEHTEYGQENVMYTVHDIICMLCCTLHTPDCYSCIVAIHYIIQTCIIFTIGFRLHIPDQVRKGVYNVQYSI